MAVVEILAVEARLQMVERLVEECLKAVEEILVVIVEENLA